MLVAEASPYPSVANATEPDAEPSTLEPALTIGRADYAERRQRRLERLRARANKLATSGHARLGLARNTARLIPFGQPILVGHHSERSHRRDLKRIKEGHSRGFADLEKAEALAPRAKAERNDAVSSDDPAALTKLQGEVEKLTLAHTRWRAINAALRSKKTGKLEALELTHDERRTIELSQGWTSYKNTRAGLSYGPAARQSP